jgi:L-iditol 2-dehydrogenase
MKAARLYAPHDIRVGLEPDPEPRPDEELVRVSAVGLCGSDRHWFAEGSIGDSVLARPLVLGHEIAGVIASGPNEGQRVAVDPAVPCGRCDLCSRDLAHLCRELTFAGHGVTDGGLQTLLAWPRRLLVPIPDSIGVDEGALLEPLGVALHAIDLGKIRSGMSAGVFGCGPIGLLIIHVLSRLGVRPILATDPLPHRRAAAIAAGADDVRPPLSEPDIDLSNDPETSEFDIVFEVAGNDGAVHDAMTVVRPGGRVILVGIPSSDNTSFQASLARRKGLTLLLSRRMRASHLGRAVASAAAGEVDLGSLITARYSLEDTGAALQSLTRYDGLKIVVKPQS